jgi:NUBPL iron-transfer P-loop NTPase
VQGQSPLTGRGVALLSPLFPKRNLDHALANIAKKSSTHLFERDGLAEIIGWPPGIVQDQTRDQADARCFGTQEDEAAIGDCHVKKVLRWRTHRSFDEKPMESKTLQRRTKRSRIDSVGALLIVGSGKGGVGKSTISVNLAAALAKRGSQRQ